MSFRDSLPSIFGGKSKEERLMEKQFVAEASNQQSQEVVKNVLSDDASFFSMINNENKDYLSRIQNIDPINQQLYMTLLGLGFDSDNNVVQISEALCSVTFVDKIKSILLPLTSVGVINTNYDDTRYNFTMMNVKDSVRCVMLSTFGTNGMLLDVSKYKLVKTIITEHIKACAQRGIGGMEQRTARSTWQHKEIGKLSETSDVAKSLWSS